MCRHCCGGNMLPQSARATDANRFVLQEASKLPAHTGAVRWRSDSNIISTVSPTTKHHNARTTFATTSHDYRPVDMKPNHPYILPLQPSFPHYSFQQDSDITDRITAIVMTAHQQTSSPDGIQSSHS